MSVEQEECDRFAERAVSEREAWISGMDWSKRRPVVLVSQEDVKEIMRGAYSAGFTAAIKAIEDAA